MNSFHTNSAIVDLIKDELQSPQSQLSDDDIHDSSKMIKLLAKEDKTRQELKILAILNQKDEILNHLDGLIGNDEYQCKLFNTDDYRAAQEIIRSNDLSLIIADWDVMSADRPSPNFNPE